MKHAVRICFGLLLGLITIKSRAQSSDSLQLDKHFWYQMSIGKQGPGATSSDAWLEIGLPYTSKGFLLPRTDSFRIIGATQGNLIYSYSDSGMFLNRGYWDQVVTRGIEKGVSQVFFNALTGQLKIIRSAYWDTITLNLGTNLAYGASRYDTAFNRIIFTRMGGGYDTLGIPVGGGGGPGGHTYLPGYGLLNAPNDTTFAVDTSHIATQYGLTTKANQIAFIDSVTALRAAITSGGILQIFNKYGTHIYGTDSVGIDTTLIPTLNTLGDSTAVIRAAVTTQIAAALTPYATEVGLQDTASNLRTALAGKQPTGTYYGPADTVLGHTISTQNSTTARLDSLAAQLIHPTDTVSKWLYRIYRSNDTVYACKGGACNFAFLDSLSIGYDSVYIYTALADSAAALRIALIDTGVSIRVAIVDTASALRTALAGKEPTITPPLVVKRYWNGYKQFVNFNTDSIPQGTTNLYFTTGDTSGLAGKATQVALTDTAAALRSAIAAAVPTYQALTAGVGMVTNSYTPAAAKIFNVDSTVMATLTALKDTAINLRGLIVTGFDSATTQGAAAAGGFHTRAYNDTRYLNLFDTTGAGGFTSLASRQKLSDSLIAVMLRYRLVSDTTGANSTTSRGTTYKVVDSAAFAAQTALVDTAAAIRGASYSLYPRQGLSPIGTHQDSIALGGLIGAFFQPDTLYINYQPWLWANLNGKTTGGTDSVIAMDANNRIWKEPFPTGGGGSYDSTTIYNLVHEVQDSVDSIQSRHMLLLNVDSIPNTDTSWFSMGNNTYAKALGIHSSDTLIQIIDSSTQYKNLYSFKFNPNAVSGISGWTVAGSTIYPTSSRNVGIGTTTAFIPLSVVGKSSFSIQNTTPGNSGLLNAMSITGIQGAVANGAALVMSDISGAFNVQTGDTLFIGSVFTVTNSSETGYLLNSYGLNATGGLLNNVTNYTGVNILDVTTSGEMKAFATNMSAATGKWQGFMSGTAPFYIGAPLYLGAGDSTGHASVLLDMSSTTQGFLISRMNTTQMTALTAVTGLQIYNTDSNALCIYNGTAWRQVGSSPAIFTGSSPGLVPSSSGSATTFLSGAGTFIAPATPGLSAVLAAGSNISGSTGVTNAGTFTFTNGASGAGVFKWNGLSHDTIGTTAVMIMGPDSTQRAATWPNFAAELTPYMGLTRVAAIGAGITPIFPRNDSLFGTGFNVLNNTGGHFQRASDSSTQLVVDTGLLATSVRLYNALDSFAGLNVAWSISAPSHGYLYPTVLSDSIGINTITPGAQLEVNGNTIIDSTLKVNGPIEGTYAPTITASTNETRSENYKLQGGIVYQNLQNYSLVAGSTGSNTWALGSNFTQAQVGGTSTIDGPTFTFNQTAHDTTVVRGMAVGYTASTADSIKNLIGFQLIGTNPSGKLQALTGFYASGGTMGNVLGYNEFSASDATLASGAILAGFQSNIAHGANKYTTYETGTGDNYTAGTWFINVAPDSVHGFRVNRGSEFDSLLALKNVSTAGTISYFLVKGTDSIVREQTPANALTTMGGIVNPMTTTNDMIYSSSGSTPSRLPIGTTGQILSVAPTTGNPTWTSSGTVVAKTDIAGSVTGGQTITSYAVPGSGGTNNFDLGGYIHIQSVSIDILQFQVTFTGGDDNTSHTIVLNSGSLSSLSTTGYYLFPSVEITVKQGTTITIATSLTTSSGSISYGAGAFVRQLY